MRVRTGNSTVSELSDGSQPITPVRLRDDSLDGLRGFAALGVLFAHLVTYLGLLPYSPLGGVGVLIFFVLSGYLIARICAESVLSGQDVRTFYTRRIRRLAPVNIALVMVSLPLIVLLGEPLGEALRDGGAALTQTTAYGEAAGVDVHYVLAPTWSLSVEWVFYLSAPLIFLLAARRRLKPRQMWRLAAVGAVALYGVGLLLDFVSFYYLPIANLGAMFAGASLGMYHIDCRSSRRECTQPEWGLRISPAWSMAGLVMLMILVVLPGHTLSWGYKVAVFPAVVLSAVVVIHGCWARERVANTLVLSWLPCVGLRAYSLYLWHMPVMWTAWVILGPEHRWWTAAVTFVVLPLVVAASFRFLEEPTLRNHRTSTSRMAARVT